MNEDKLRQLSEEIPVPESLSPNEMEQKLARINQNGKRYRRRIIIKTAAATAACFLLVIGVFHFLGGTERTILLPEPVPVADPEKAEGSQQADPDKKTTSYDKCYDTISGYFGTSASNNEMDLAADVDVAENEVAKSAASAPQAQDTNGSGAARTSESYTKTNTQVDGVDEGDIVKTDGSYIYVCTDDALGSTIQIMKADGRNSKKVSTISIDQFSVSELYVDQNRLAAVGRDWEHKDGAEEQTGIATYDISDAKKPKLCGRQTQSGIYETSRKTGNYLYTMSMMYVQQSDLDKDSKESYVPKCGNQVLAEDKLYCPENISSCCYLVITSLDLTNPDQFTDEQAILGGGGTYYVSENNIYNVAPPDGFLGTSVISKFCYKDGKLDFLCEHSLRANVLNQFSLDEYNGYLRLVGTTTHIGGSTSNGLYILDENLKPVGSIANLARGERIYSARFMETKAYFVTYRETDPLFAVDLSDPKNPVVMDQLKIPGFSEYLHPFRDNLLLGIGADETSDTRVKLSMFDISSDTDIKEQDKLLLKEGTYSMAGSNHKSVLVDTKRNRIGFCTSNYYRANSQATAYQVYCYTEKGFKKIATLTPPGLNMETTRGLYIGDYLYLADGQGVYGIVIYDAGSMKKVGKVVF